MFRWTLPLESISTGILGLVARARLAKQRLVIKLNVRPKFQQLFNAHFSSSSGFADASVAPIDFPIAPAAAMPKVHSSEFIQLMLCLNKEQLRLLASDSFTLDDTCNMPIARKRVTGTIRR